MREVIVHIGPHKTGTSALQAAFHRNADSLAERGLLYRPMGKEWNNHHVLAVQFRREGGDATAGRAFVDDLFDEADRRNLCVLISSEMLCEPQIDTDEFISAMQPAAVRTVGYLRNPCDLMVSAYNQVVRDPSSRRTKPIDAAPPPYDVSMANILRPWITDGRLTLCPYDPPQWKDGTLLGDFLATIGVDPAGLDLDNGCEGPPDNENRSLPYLFVEAVRYLNAAGIDEESRQRVISILYGASASAEQNATLDGAMTAACIEAIRGQLPTYQPFLRDGFQTHFLLQAPLGVRRAGTGEIERTAT